MNNAQVIGLDSPRKVQQDEWMDAVRGKEVTVHFGGMLYREMFADYEGQRGTVVDFFKGCEPSAIVEFEGVRRLAVQQLDLTWSGE